MIVLVEWGKGSEVTDTQEEKYENLKRYF